MDKKSTDPKPNIIYRHDFIVLKEVVDQNGHVNNVAYVQWMQDVASLHSDTTGGTRAAHEANGSWVARSHNIEYLSPAFANDEVIALTWVVNFRRVRSLRRYRFLRKNDNKLLAKGETEWVFVDAGTGRPRSIPDEVMQAFPLLPKGEEP